MTDKDFTKLTEYFYFGPDRKICYVPFNGMKPTDESFFEIWRMKFHVFECDPRDPNSKKLCQYTFQNDTTEKNVTSSTQIVFYCDFLCKYMILILKDINEKPCDDEEL
jgi:hypothetical protein